MFQNKEQASLYIFNVGQANLFIFKDKDNAFVFDCGFNLKVINIIPYSETINNILSGIKPTIIISHQDLDHFGCLNDFFPPQERKKVIIGGFPIAGKKYIGDDIYFVENQRNGKILNSKFEQLDFSIDELTQCKDIQFFFTENNKSKKNNHQSLIFKLEIYGRNILFPGDLDNTLLNKLIATRGYQEFFSNIDVFIFPHHGGNSNGELSLFALLNDESQSTVPVLSIISSDANKQNSIPTSIIFNLKFENSDSYIEKHSITVYSIYKKEVCTFEKKMALFVSSDAKSKYYEIIFNMNGTINLLDAGKRPLFSNIRDFSEEEIISQILKYYTIENSLYCKWLIQKLKTLLLQYHISEIASMLKFIIGDESENFKWTSFILSHELLGNNYQEILIFLLKSLYKYWSNYQKSFEFDLNGMGSHILSGTLHFVKRFSPKDGFTPKIKHYISDINVIREIIGEIDTNFESFLQNSKIIKLIQE